MELIRPNLTEAQIQEILQQRNDATICKYCQQLAFWTTSKQGKRYLADEVIVGRKTIIHPKHDCCTPEQKSAINQLRNAENQNQIAQGEMVVGQTVEVVKGRKLPHGTIGKVFWISAKADDYGVFKIGVMVNDQKHYINIQNVQVAAKVGA